MPTILRIGPYRFFFTQGIAMNRVMYTLNAMIKSRNSGWTRPGFKVAAGFRVWNWTGYGNW